jgi:GTPase SAR1 family protein
VIKFKEIDLEELDEQIENINQNFSTYALVYDVTFKKSFKKVEEAVQKLRDKQCLKGYKRVIVVGNKVDKMNRTVSKEQGEALGQKYGIFVELSAQQPIDIETVYTNIWASTPFSSKLQTTPTLQSAPPFSQAAPPQLHISHSSTNYKLIINSILIGS